VNLFGLELSCELARGAGAARGPCAGPDHATQARLIRRYIAWRNRNPTNAKLRRLINTANVA